MSAFVRRLPTHAHSLHLFSVEASRYYLRYIMCEYVDKKLTRGTFILHFKNSFAQHFFLIFDFDEIWLNDDYISVFLRLL